MTHPSATIRHAQHALHLLIGGAIRDIEVHNGPAADGVGDPLTLSNTVQLFNNLVDELEQWEIPNTNVGNMTGLVDAMQAMLSDPNCPVVVRELLADNDLLP